MSGSRAVQSATHTYQCYTCKRWFSSEWGLGIHMIKSHRDPVKERGRRILSELSKDGAVNAVQLEKARAKRSSSQKHTATNDSFTPGLHCRLGPGATLRVDIMGDDMDMLLESKDHSMRLRANSNVVMNNREAMCLWMGDVFGLDINKACEALEAIV